MERFLYSNPHSVSSYPLDNSLLFFHLHTYIVFYIYTFCIRHVVFLCLVLFLQTSNCAFFSPSDCVYYRNKSKFCVSCRVKILKIINSSDNTVIDSCIAVNFFDCLNAGKIFEIRISLISSRLVLKLDL